MKKLMALCLSLIMVVSMFTVAVSAATPVTIPGATLIDQSFAGPLTAETFPSDWTITGNGYEFLDEGINPGKHADVGATGVYKNKPFNAGNADYTFTVKLAHKNGTQYIHFGADSAEDAIAEGINVAGYTFTAMMSESYKSGEYMLYKDGVPVEGLTLTDKDQSWFGYQGVRDYSFKVTSTGLEITGPFADSPLTVNDAEPIKSGYVGASIACSEDSQVPRLNHISLTTDEYSYEINDAQENTGATVSWDNVTEGQEYVNVESIKLTGDDRNLCTLAENIEIPADKDARLSLTIGTPVFNDATTNFNFLGYTLKFTKSGDVATISLLDGTTVLKTVEVSASTIGSNTGGFYYGDANVSVVMTASNITATVAKGTTVAATLTSDITSRHNTGSISVAWLSYHPDCSRKVTNLILETLDKTTTTTKTDFILDRTFSANDTVEGLNADGFTDISGTPTENGISANSGTRAIVAYTGAAFGGSYTVETKAYGEYNQSETITFATAKGDYYELVTEQTQVSIIKSKDGVSETVTEATNAYYTPTRSHKVVFQENEGKLTITAYIGNTKTIEYTDDTPITDSRTIKVKTGQYNPVNEIYNLKVYPTSKANDLGYDGVFNVDGVDAAASEKGNIYFAFPVTMLGQSPDFIAALYEDGKMTDIRFYTVDEINEAPVALFDTTNGAAENVTVKVFVWDSLAGMVPVLYPFTLQ